MENYYDSHCHVFDRKDTINLRLIIEIILSLPNIFGKKKSNKMLTSNDIKDKITTLKRILNFLKVGLSDSEEDIYQIMQQVYNNKFNAAPLMFDLECCFVSNRSGNNKLLEYNDINAVQQQLEDIIASFNTDSEKYIDDAMEMINSKHYVDLPEGTTTDLHLLYKLHIELATRLNELKLTKLNKQALPVALISSYEIQLNDISKLKADHKENVFPFIAIDPRRKGIIDRFINEIYPKKTFCGVKLYTPNGYSPSDDDLMKAGGLYDFCCKHNIPITAHNSYGGFASPLKKIEIYGDIYINNTITNVHGDVTFKKAFSDGWVQDRADKLNNPEIWDSVVMKKYPTLKLNLAHFGNGNPQWQDKVSSMMLKYPNFYTDLSCWTDKKDLINFRSKYFVAASDVRFKEKVLYGSDFYLDLLFIDSFQEYVNNFMQVFTSDEFTQIALTNAKKFLFG